MSQDAVISHAVGRFYRCPSAHTFDNKAAKDPSMFPFPSEKTCPTCGQTAPVQYDVQTHTTAEKCPFGQCANPLPQSPPQT